MTAIAPTKDQLAVHVDHDVSQFLRLHREMNSFRYCLYPEAVRRAVVVAYAAHFRALLEFFHDGRRPEPVDMKAAGCEARADVTFTSFSEAKPRPAWTPNEMKRLCDADKLLGHLSESRVNREGNYSPWGTAADLDLMRGHVKELLAADTSTLLPKANVLRDVL